jgi:hypothetical protein
VSTQPLDVAGGAPTDIELPDRSVLFAGLWRLIGYGGRRCHVCRTSLVSHRIPSTGKYVCAKCAG